MLAYLSGPIDHYVHRELHDRTLARQALMREGFSVYDPSTAFHFGGDAMGSSSAIYAVNEAARKRSDAHLALWPEGASSIGTPIEIDRSHTERQPVAVCGGLQSVQLSGMGVQRFLESDFGLAAAWLAECVREQPVRSTNEFGLDQFEARFSPGGSQARGGVVFRDGGGSPPREIRWTGEQAFKPTQGYDGDAGFDLYCSEDTVVPYQGFADVPCGIRIELPPDTWAMVTGRSSTIRKRRLLVNQGIIDNGYRGPIFAATWNLGLHKVTVERGQRIAQLIPFSLDSAGLRWRRVDALNESVRGEKAFGSSGA